MDLETQVKLKIYALVARDAHMPESSDIARELGIPQSEVEAAFERLFTKRLLVLEPGDRSRIRMPAAASAT